MPNKKIIKKFVDIAINRRNASRGQFNATISVPNVKFKVTLESRIVNLPVDTGRDVKIDSKGPIYKAECCSFY